MQKNKFTTYLLYAIGEIFLVVIGILIAVSLNNWNEQRKEILQSEEYIKEIIIDLKKDQLLLNQLIDLVDAALRGERKLLETLRYDTMTFVQIDTLLSNIYLDSRLFDNTYKKISNAGLSTLLGYESVYDSISNYYQVEHHRFNVMVEWDKEASKDREMNPLVLDIIEIDYSSFTRNKQSLWYEMDDSFPNSQSELKRLSLLKKEMQTIKFRNSIRIKYMRHWGIRKQLMEILKKNETLLAYLENLST